MATLYMFDRNGNRLKTFSGTVPAKPLSYLGGEYVTFSEGSGGAGGFSQYAYNAATGAVTLVTEWRPEGEGEAFQGIAYDHSKWDSSVDNDHFDARSYYTFRVFGDAGTNGFFLEQHDHDGDIVRQYLLAVGEGDPAVAYGLEFDGHMLFMLWEIDDRVRISQIDIVASGAEVVADFANVDKKSADITWDGQYFYVPNTSVVNQYLLDPNAKTVRSVKVWAHGLNDPRGITFDGNNLLIASA